MENINEEVEKTLKSWDNIKRFESNPFLYTRIEQQIKNSKAPQENNWRWIWQSVLVTVLVALNFFTIATALSNSENGTQSAYEVIADQYNLAIEENQNGIGLY